MGAYLSYPFCAQKCTYCNFASGVLPRELEPAYLQALEAELAATDWPWTPETVYLGGGTPSLIPVESLRTLLARIPGRPWREATIEAAPGSLPPDGVRRWVDAGINRVSLGVQSFVEAEIRRTGRRHSAETVAADVRLLREHGIEGINIDLIAGLAGQTEASWEESLDWVESLGVPHVSVYMLEVDDESRLGRELLLGGVRYGAGDVPGEEVIVRLYERAVARLASAGLARYEISNFARPGAESLHNLKYWQLEPYLGFGADAHSFAGGCRWQNVESAQDYVARCTRLESARAEETTAILFEERFFVGLRLAQGVEPLPEEWVRFGGVIERFVEQGLLEKDGVRLRLTSQGILLSNEVFQEFIGT